MSKPILPNPDEQHTSETGTIANREDSPTAHANHDTGDSRGRLEYFVGSTADPAADPFDPASLRLSQDFASSIGVKRVFTRIRCGKPDKYEFVRVRPGEEWRLETCLLELKGSQDKPGQETYLVAPALRDELASEVRPAVLFCAINRQKVPLLWRCWLPGIDGRANRWTDTLLDAARLAERAWVTVKAGSGDYEIQEARGQLPEPEWPDWSLREWVRLAFQDRHIATIDHPVLRALRGEI